MIEMLYKLHATAMSAKAGKNHRPLKGSASQAASRCICCATAIVFLQGNGLSICLCCKSRKHPQLHRLKISMAVAVFITSLLGSPQLLPGCTLGSTLYRRSRASKGASTITSESEHLLLS